MATRLDGNVRKATANTVTSMRRSAESRRCPKCQRKSALRRDAEMRATYCRWALVPVPKGWPGEYRSMCDYYISWDALEAEDG